MASARIQRRVVPDAAGQLDLHVELADDLGEQFAVGPATEGGVEVDEVHPLGAVLLPAQRGLERVAVPGLAAGLALNQPDGLAIGDIDGGQQTRNSPAHPSRDASASCSESSTHGSVRTQNASQVSSL